MSPDRLDGEIAIVTGGANGIGAATARRLAADGAQVAILDIDEVAARTLAAELDGSMYVAADVSDADAVADAVARVVAELGSPTVLVNNAAWLRDYEPLLETSAETWRRSLAVTLDGAVIVSRAVLHHMVREGRGSIVNVASVGGLVVFPRRAAYVTAKAAVIQLTRSIAVDYGAHGVRANAVLPGAIRTPHLEANLRNDADRRRREQMSVLGRFGEPEEIAGVIAFLAGADASYVTGAMVVVDGGWTLR